MKAFRTLKALALGAALLAGTSVATSAQTVEEFYSQNDITLMVGAAAGGSADFFARTIAPYLTKYMPGNPEIVVQNKPGAGGLVVAAEMQNTAPRDGSWIGTLQRNNFTDPLLADERVDFDAREVSHLGAISKVTYVIFSYGEDPGIKTIEDALAHEMILAGTGAGSANNTYPQMVNDLLGGNFKVIPGYTGNEEQALAIERGEADGRAISYSSTQRGQLKQWLDAGQLHYIMQFALERNPNIPGIPNVFEAVKDDETRNMFRFMLLPQEIGRPFAAPPGVPEERLAALREAFDKAGNDPEFMAEIDRSGADTGYTSGLELQEMASELMGTPPERVEKVKKLLAGE